ncbi:hypothetical protein ACEPUD_19915 [Burkholderia ubonensis]|uniref:hypothetical protein n=1 Tax=Burkholderia ubonensis TaxID=101571 RepID=UPI00358F22B3
MHILNDLERKKVEDYLSVTGPWQAAYGDGATFSFIAVRDGTKLSLVQGHVIYPSGVGTPPTLEVQTPTICGCAVRMSTLGIGSNGFIESLLGEGIKTPIGTVSLRDSDVDRNGISAFFQHYPGEFESTREHTVSLTLSWGQHAFTNRQGEFFNDLRTAAKPYDSVTELANELWLRPIRWDTCTLDFSAHSPVAVDLQRSIAQGVVRLGILVLRGVDVAGARLGYRVIVTGRVVERRTLTHQELTWTDEGRVNVGEIEVPVPPGGIVQCFASYLGQFLHHGWVVEPGSFPNVRRVAHEVFDPQLENTRKCLFDAKTLKQDARNLEAGVANVLYLLGFTVDPLFGKPQSDNPDLIAMTPSGDVVVVECTTAAIDVEGKLSKLLSRTVQLEEKLKSTGNAHVRVLPAIVTSLSRRAITDERAAIDARIVVVTSEDLERALARSIVPQDANAMFEEKWRATHPPEDPLLASVLSP